MAAGDSIVTREVEEYVTRMRRYFHQNPELSFKEHKTADRIEEELRSFGLEPRRIGETGVVADITGTGEGRKVALRADMDALPVMEETGLEFKSKTDGVMHACGHDSHVSMALGAAKLLKSKSGEFRGTVRMLFQAAEESPPGGAVILIRNGELKDIDYVIGQHVISNYPTGKVAISSGAIMANADQFRIRIIGVGGHGSEPQRAIDALSIACQYVVMAQTIVSRKVAPFNAAVVTFGTMNSGYRYNIIAPYAELTGTVRTFDSETQDLIEKELEKMLEGLSVSTGCKYEYEYEKGYPAVINDEEMSAVVEEVVSGFLGEDSILHPDPVMGGEDFAYYLQEVPGAFYFLGVGNEKKGITSPMHSPTFTLDEDAMKYGTEILVRTALKLLERN